MQELGGSRCQKQQKKKSAVWRDQSGLPGLCQGASRRPLSITFDEKIPGGNTHSIRFDGDHAFFCLRDESISGIFGSVHPPYHGSRWMGTVLSSAGPRERLSGISYLLYPGRPTYNHARTP